MIKINLLPVRAAEKKEKLREQIILLVVGLVLVLVGCGIAYTTALTKISQKKTEIAQRQATIEDLKKKIGEVDKVKKLQEELQAKLDVLDKLKANKTGPAHLFDELALAVPEKLWVDTFDVVGGKVNLSGVGVSEEIVATFLQQLEASPYFAKVELESLELTTMEGNKLHKFKVVAQEENPAVKKPESAGNEQGGDNKSPQKKS